MNNIKKIPIIILMQGPIRKNTIQIYKKYKEFFDVMVSTYAGECNLEIENKDLISSNKIPNMGLYNRNGQRYTTNMGLKTIKSLYKDCFVLKTRSDHYFKKIKNSISQFINFLEIYSDCPNGQQKRMIIPNLGTTFNTFWGEYHLSDHWMFGKVDDVIEYYTIDNVDLSKDFQFDSNFSPEPEFCLKWMENKKIKESFEELLAKRFIILDDQELDYTEAKNCELLDCNMDWEGWTTTADFPNVVSHEKWKLLYQKYISQHPQ